MTALHAPTWRPAFTVTDTELTIHTSDFPQLAHDAWRALCEWALFHDIDPKRVPMCSTIVRNVEGCRVEYDQIEVDERGRKVVGADDEVMRRRVCSQGEAPPLPWPTVLLEAATR
jgi:hypothetical protein